MRGWAILAAALVLPTVVPTAHADAAGDAGARGLAWLAAHQQPSGTFGGYLPVYAAEAAAEAGLDLGAWPTAEHPALRDLAPYDYNNGGSGPLYSAERRAHALGMDGRDPRAFQGEDLVAEIQSNLSGGQYGDPAYLNDDAWAILGLRAAGVAPSDAGLQSAASFLLSGRSADGGWANKPSATSGDTDDTGAALVALASAGRLSGGDVRAALYLNSTHAQGGGHGSAVGVAPTANCQSTVWALRGYRALRIDPPADDLPYLLSLQHADGGFGKDAHDDPDGFCTAEAVAFLAEDPAAGAPSYRSCGPLVGEVHALEPATLAVPAAFASASWTVGGQQASGRFATLTFPAKGDVPLSVDASGPGLACRVRGTLRVGTARPVVALGSGDLAAPRLATVALDVSRSRDPDGRIVAWRVDWGDGNATALPSHAYALPGVYAAQVAAQDDEGAWSDITLATVHVRNLPPRLSGLPAALVADRAHDITLPVDASDPEGDPVSVSWALGGLSGEGAPHLRPAELGNATLALLARDPYGGEASANVSVEVVDLPPALANVTLPGDATEGEPFAFSAEASDPDGPEPTIAWTLGNVSWSGARGEIALPAGPQRVVVAARDAEGLEARVERTLLVAPRGAPPPAAEPPAVLSVEGALDNGTLRVAARLSPANATGLVLWTSAAGNGSAPLVDGHAEVPLPGATEVDITVEARAGNLTASQAAGPFRAPPPPLAAPVLHLPPLARPGAPVTLSWDLPEGATEALVDFGDGTGTGWTNATSAEHAWARAGAYGLRVEARAPDGRASAVDAGLAVEAAPAPLEKASAPAPTPAPVESVRVTPPEAQAAKRAPAPPAWMALAMAATLAAARRARGRRGPR